tara:strand:+ start:447 stop:1136 length:690 start_codon:yes stop_codon:yes gene_type:complete
MAKTETVEILIEGGKASPAPPLGSSLGPLKVNVAQIVKDINSKTQDFKGMKVPVKVEVSIETKEYTITIGTPPVSALIKKEINLKRLSSEPNKTKFGVMAFEQAIKIAKMKQDAFFGDKLKSAVKTVIGSCQSAGIQIDGKDATVVLKEIDTGKYDDLIKKGVTEVPEEKKKELQAIQKKLDAQVQKLKKAKDEAKAEAEAKAAKKAEASASAPAAPAAVKPAVKPTKK